MKTGFFLFVLLFSGNVSAQTGLSLHGDEAAILSGEGLQTVKGQLTGSSVFADINAGYSNAGVIGFGGVNYRTRNAVFTLGYTRSHDCILNDDKGRIFENARSTDRHITTSIGSVSAGIILPGKLHPVISIGLSAGEIMYAKTTPMVRVLSTSTFAATATGNSFGEEELEKSSHFVVGIPVEIKLNFASRRCVGFVTTMKADLNPEKVVLSATLGMRLGRMLRN